MGGAAKEAGAAADGDVVAGGGDVDAAAREAGDEELGRGGGRRFDSQLVAAADEVQGGGVSGVARRGEDLLFGGGADVSAAESTGLLAQGGEGALAVVEEEPELGVRVLLEERLIEVAEGVERGGDVVAPVGGQGDEDPAAVVGVGEPFDEAGAFEAVEDAGDPARGEAGDLGEAPGGHAAFEDEGAEASEVGAVELEGAGKGIGVETGLVAEAGGGIEEAREEVGPIGRG
jgi:hypothetical protein